MRIAFVVGQLTLGGAERQLYLSVRELIALGWDVHVITCHAGCGDYWEKPMQDAGAVLHGIGAGTSRLAKVVRVSALLRRIKPAVVHSWTLHTNVYAALAGKIARVPVRVGSERSTEAASRDVLGRLYRLQVTGLDALVTNNRAAESALARSTPSLRVVVVPNAVELPLPADIEAARMELRRTWQVPGDALVIGAIGGLVPGKNFDGLMKAVDPLFERYPNLRLVIAGEGPARPALEQQAADRLRQGRVRLPGHVVPAARAAAAFDLLCLSSLHEGLPNVVMEAMAAGVAVVASDVGGVRQLIEHGANGVVVPPGDLDALRTAIAELVASPETRSRFGTEGRASMAERFTPRVMVSSLLGAYGLSS